MTDDLTALRELAEAGRALDPGPIGFRTIEAYRAMHNVLSFDAVLSLLDRLESAEAEANDLSRRLSEYLCEATGGLLSYSNYPVSTMLTHTQDYFERLAKETHDEGGCERAERAEAAIERAEAEAEKVNREHLVMSPEALILADAVIAALDTRKEAGSAESS